MSEGFTDDTDTTRKTTILSMVCLAAMGQRPVIGAERFDTAVDL